MNIAAEGPSGSLDFYWAANGSSTWTTEIVAGPGSISTAPAITANDGSVNLVANIGMWNGLAFYWAINGTATWHLETLPGWFGGTPAITTDPGGVHVIVIGASGGIADDATSNGTGTQPVTRQVPVIAPYTERSGTRESAAMKGSLACGSQFAASRAALLAAGSAPDG